MNTSLPTFLSINNEKKGPFTHQQILDMYQNQSLKSAKLFWQEGMTDWAPVEKLLAQLANVSQPPSLAAAPSAATRTAASETDVYPLIIGAYVCTGLSIIPIFGFITALIAVILGIIMCRKKITAHGVINIVTSIFISLVMMAVLLVAALTLMQPQIKEIFYEAQTELDSRESTLTRPYPEAEKYYAVRLNTPLTRGEQALVGNWSGENVDFKWEIMRKADGTYALAFIFPDADYGEDIVYGIWGIENGQFYYMDLEVVGYSPEGQPEKAYENIEKINSNLLVTTYIDEEDKIIRSTEKRVARFKFKIWKSLDKNGRYP